MAELPQVVPGEPIQSTTFGNPVIDRVISRYPDATQRDFAVPLPQAGDPAYLTATGELQVYDGTEWLTYALVEDMNLKVNRAGDVMTGPLELTTGSSVKGTAAALFDLERTDVPQVWRKAVDAAGNLVIQAGPDTGSLVTALVITEDGRNVTFPEPTVSTSPVGDVNNPGYAFAGGGGLLAGAGGTLVGVVGPNGQWASYCTNFQFTVFGDGEIQLTIATAFTVQKVYDQTTSATPNVNVNSGGAIRRSTAVVALQADLEALELQVATLQATVDAL